MFFDRPESGELAILVHLDFSNDQDVSDPREFEELVLSAGGDPVAFVTGQRSAPQPKFFIGSGKLEELRQQVQMHGANLVIFNHNLSPSQERNIERELRCRVLDRNGLILDIFAQRARTHEGKLQVELAQLRHISTRLIRGWTHLERQKGGIGLRGPGETQLETDRRLLRIRIKSIEKRLQKVRTQRDQGRRARRRASLATVSLVGYTNAGKSTLFNCITAAGVYAEDQLFATLDPTMRRIEIADIGAAILVDTVGFISQLPHRLIEAFRATLEEAASADLLLHVIDAADEERERNVTQVEQVLREIGAGSLPVLKIYNKTDLLNDCRGRVDRDSDGKPVAIWLSAQSGEGVELLPGVLGELLGEEIVQRRLRIPVNLGRFRARLYQQNAVLDEIFQEDGTSELELRLPQADLRRILTAENLEADELDWVEIVAPDPVQKRLMM